MTETLRAANRLTAALSQVDQLILETTDMERVIRAVLNAIRSNQPNNAWVLTCGHETVPAERLYWVDRCATAAVVGGDHVLACRININVTRVFAMR